MLLNGLQKLTLLDFPGKVACTLFFGGCNFRCPFCHNASLVLHPNEGETISEEEILAFLKKRSGLLDGVCITGGEPTLQKGLPDLIRSIRALGYAVKLDTNGTDPAMLKELVGKGMLDYVAMDIKNAPDRYAETIGVPDYDLSTVRESAAYLMEDHVPYEFRTTVVRGLHDEMSFRGIADWIRGASAYYLQSFVDSGDVIGKGLEAFSKSELEAFRNVMLDAVPATLLREVK